MKYTSLGYNRLLTNPDDESIGSFAYLIHEEQATRITAA
jgi:hypothetical protein